MHQLVYGINEETLYDKDIYMKNYESYNMQVRDYFRFRPDDLLTLNLSDPAAMQKLCAFLEIEYTGQTMPHENKS